MMKRLLLLLMLACCVFAQNNQDEDALGSFFDETSEILDREGQAVVSISTAAQTVCIYEMGN